MMVLGRRERRLAICTCIVTLSESSRPLYTGWAWMELAMQMRAA
jgi:hypothetical protein